ncbi:type II secretion system F family protein [Actinotignum schaalii]|uniref:type II secretion system F family protein n=1 Tax=Actinotignum schaalii TaxID=59505 RepID=UPI00373E399C
MGLIVGALLATGILTVIRALSAPDRSGWSARQRKPRITIPTRRLGIALCCGLGLALGALLTTGHPFLGAAGGTVGIWLPFWHARHTGRKAREAQRLAWPDRIDQLLSSLRAGRTIPEALLYLATRPDAPPALRSFATHVETSGRFDTSLTRLKDSFQDPVSDRVLEILRLAVRHGGYDLPRVLESLALSLRAENRARGELMARQSWTVNGARVAALAPWLVLLLLSTHPGTMEAFTSPTGTIILLAGLGVTFLAYALMNYLGRLPEEERILAASPPAGGLTSIAVSSPRPSRARRAAV